MLIAPLFNKPLIIHGRQRYLPVKYTHANQKYTVLIRVPTLRNPIRIIRITENKLGEDVTQRVLEFYGPMRDWHGLGNTFTPGHMGFTQGLTFVYGENSEKRVESNEALSEI